jgi:hypothetical protein
MANENTKETVGASIRGKLQPSVTLADIIESILGTEENPKEPDLEKLRKHYEFLRKVAESTKTSATRLVEITKKYCEDITIDEKYR